MFDVAPSELLIVAVVALIVIGPKDLPQTMRVVGRWVGKARGVARHFRSGFDAMVREAELEEMEKRWADENARIMREHPPEPVADTADIAAAEPAPTMLPVEQASAAPPAPAAGDEIAAAPPADASPVTNRPLP